MANGAAGLAMAVTTGKMNMDIISGTLDALNSGTSCKKSSGSSDMADTYNFSKDVLSAAYNPVGLVVSSMG